MGKIESLVYCCAGYTEKFNYINRKLKSPYVKKRGEIAKRYDHFNFVHKHWPSVMKKYLPNTHNQNSRFSFFSALLLMTSLFKYRLKTLRASKLDLSIAG